MRRRPEQGFTLIEIVLVITLLSIISLGTTYFIVRAVQQYNDADRRSQLIAEGRVLIEQIARPLRNALPNSIRVTASGQCVEFFPVLAATRSLDTSLSGLIATLQTAAFDWDYSGESYVAVSPLAPDELYKSSFGIEEVIAKTSFVSSGVLNSIPLAVPKIFVRNSDAHRLFLVSNPQRFCLTSAGELTAYSEYGIKSVLTNTDPGGTAVLLGQHIDTTATSFAYSTGSPVENALLTISLVLNNEGDRLALKHEVHVRNVP